MTKFGSDELILVARFLLVLLFLIFGWDKLTDYSGTVAYMVQSGAPVPPLSAVIAIIMEFFVSLAILLGVLTRPLAILLAVYTFATAIIGHHYWSMTGAVQYDNMVHFYKNISIIGGLLLLYVTGAGKYSVDGWFSR
jgi:putative oxidoreductase